MAEKENRSVDRVVRLDVSDFKGNLLERWKTTIVNKAIGLVMILRLKELFGITIKEIAEGENKELNDELARQKELFRKV